MFRSSGDRRSFSVTREITVIGRREDCDLMIPLGEVSRKHCRLVRDGDLLKIEDLGSANGTFLNGQRVQESLLAPGDTIQVGPVVFVLQIDGVPADDELQPVYAEGAMMAAGGAAAYGSDADVHPGHPQDDLDGMEPLGGAPGAVPEYDPAGVGGGDDIDDLGDLGGAAPDASAGLDELEPIGMDDADPAPAGGGGQEAPIPLDDLEPAAAAEDDGLGELSELAPAEGSHEDGLVELDLLDADTEQDKKH